jgi:hypothetical protein
LVFFWGVYWVPARAIAALGLDGAWGTGAITPEAMLFLLLFLAGKIHLFRETGIVGVVSIALGGAAVALYSIGFLYGKVALVVLLWFFSSCLERADRQIRFAMANSQTAACRNWCGPCRAGATAGMRLKSHVASCLRRSRLPWVRR